MRTAHAADPHETNAYDVHWRRSEGCGGKRGRGPAVPDRARHHRWRDPARPRWRSGRAPGPVGMCFFMIVEVEVIVTSPTWGSESPRSSPSPEYDEALPATVWAQARGRRGKEEAKRSVVPGTRQVVSAAATPRATARSADPDHHSPPFSPKIPAAFCPRILFLSSSLRSRPEMLSTILPRLPIMCG